MLRPVMSLIGPSKPTLVVRFCPQLFELSRIPRRVPLKESGMLVYCCFNLLHNIIDYIIITNRPTQPPTLNGMGNEYWPKGCEALWLGSKGWYDSFHLWINM